MGRIETVTALVENGADPSVKGEYRTPLQEADENDHHEVIAYLRSQLGEGPAFTPKNALESLKQLAQKRGGKAAQSALDSGDYGYHEDDDELDSDDLPGIYWDDHKSNIENAIGVMTEETRATLPMEEPLMETLFNVYLESYTNVV